MSLWQGYMAWKRRKLTKSLFSELCAHLFNCLVVGPFQFSYYSSRFSVDMQNTTLSRVNVWPSNFTRNPTEVEKQTIKKCHLLWLDMAGNVVHVNPLVQKEGEFYPVFHAGRLKSLHITPATWKQLNTMKLYFTWIATVCGTESVEVVEQSDFENSFQALVSIAIIWQIETKI